MPIKPVSNEFTSKKRKAQGEQHVLWHKTVIHNILIHVVTAAQIT